MHGGIPPLCVSSCIKVWTNFTFLMFQSSEIFSKFKCVKDTDCHLDLAVCVTAVQNLGCYTIKLCGLAACPFTSFSFNLSLCTYL
jgi:hypothetical protein